MALSPILRFILNAMMSITRVFVLASRATAFSQSVFDEVLDLKEDLIPRWDLPIVKEKQFPHIDLKTFSL